MRACTIVAPRIENVEGKAGTTIQSQNCRVNLLRQYAVRSTQYGSRITFHRVASPSVACYNPSNMLIGLFRRLREHRALAACRARAAGLPVLADRRWRGDLPGALCRALHLPARRRHLRRSAHEGDGW